MDELRIALITLLVMSLGSNAYLAYLYIQAVKSIERSKQAVVKAMNSIASLERQMAKSVADVKKLAENAGISGVKKDGYLVAKARATIVYPEQRAFYAVQRIKDNGKLEGKQKFGYVDRLLARRYPKLTPQHRAKLIEDSLVLIKEGKTTPAS